MKARPLFILSLLLNLVLLAVLAARRPAAPAPAPAAPLVAAFQPAPEPVKSAVPRPSPTPFAPSSASSRPALNWQTVESTDYHSYIKNLRAAGVPESTIRDIVSADVIEAYAAKRQTALAERYRDFKYWEFNPDADAALVRQRRLVDAETGDTLRELLGSEFVPPSLAEAWRADELDQQLEFLSAAKRERARSTLLRYQEIDQQIKALADGHRFTEDAGELQRTLEMYEQKRAALAEVLTPEETAQLDLTVSWTSSNLRRAMAKFHPTPDEFQVIFNAWRAQDENLAKLYATHQPDPGNAAVFATIEKALRSDRYLEYRRTWWQ